MLHEDQFRAFCEEGHPGTEAMFCLMFGSSPGVDGSLNTYF